MRGKAKHKRPEVQSEHRRLKKIVGARLRGVLRETRESLRLTQEDVAERIDMAPEVYGRIERGGFLPRLPTIRRLALALGVSANHLLGLDDGSTASALPLAERGPQEEKLPAATRRALRAIRQLSPKQLHQIMGVAGALVATNVAKGKRTNGSA